MEGYEDLSWVIEADDNQTSERSLVYTDLFGPTIGTYTPTTATRGGLPSDVQRALEGVAMPVRWRTSCAINSGSVLVPAAEALDVLTAAGASEQVLRYWQGCSIDDELATVSFSLEEGELTLF